MALKAVRHAMIAKGWCRGYINKQINRVRRMFSWAAENELVPLSIYQRLANVAGLRKDRSEAREKPPIAPVSEADVERTLPHLSPMVAAMVRVQRLTGMRPGEVTTIRVEDLDRSDAACWVYRPARHKSEHHERERVIFVGPRALAILRPHLEAAEADPESGPHLFNPRRSEARRRAELRARRRSPMTPSQRARTPKPEPKRVIKDHYEVASYRRAIRRACLRAGLPIWFPHQLRHSAATEIRRRYGLEASQAVLGHAELGVTQVYAEADLSRARAIMAEAG